MEFTDRITENKKAVADYITEHISEYKTKQLFKDNINKLIQELRIDRVKNLNKIIFYLDVKRAL
jgi:hypothetical protein